ncbi:MFSD4B isoform 1 [Pongo abelii]|uniref:MFSD4B isoform 1 n=1 Tax=Pongo abelii TaxID=9601 RepID=A0A2J8U1D2_PONAB|nr:MFSD4B isoform 1 [Pongo abelii]
MLCASFLGLGLSVAILGPTFQDLATNVNRNISSLSFIFVGRALGYLSGSVIGGFLVDVMNYFLLLGISMSATTVGLYLVPFCKTAILLTVMMSIFGVSIGVLDTENEESSQHLQVHILAMEDLFLLNNQKRKVTC